MNKLVPTLIEIAQQTSRDAKAQVVWDQSLKTLVVVVLLSLAVYVVIKATRNT